MTPGYEPRGSQRYLDVARSALGALRSGHHDALAAQLVDPSLKPGGHGGSVRSCRAADDEDGEPDAADDREKHEGDGVNPPSAFIVVVTTGEQVTHRAQDVRQNVDELHQVVDLGEGVVAGDGDVAELTTPPRDGPGLSRDRQARSEDRDDDHQVAESEDLTRERGRHLGDEVVDEMELLAGDRVTPEEEQTLHLQHENAPDEPGGRHDRPRVDLDFAEPVHLVAFEPHLAYRPGVERADGGVEEEEDHQQGCLQMSRSSNRLDVAS